MITAMAYRFRCSRVHLHWILVVACAVILGISATSANAHAPVPAPVPTVAYESVSVPEQVSLAAEVDASDHAGHACPSGGTHTSHQNCIGGSACHAITMGAATGTDVYSRHKSYELDATGIGGGHDIAPLFHPPKL